METEPYAELVCLQTARLTLTIKGPAPAGTRDGDALSSLTAVCRDSFALRLAGTEKATDGTGADGVYTARCALPPLFFEQRHYELILLPSPGHTAAFRHDDSAICGGVTATGGTSVLSGVISFGGGIGLSDFEVLLDGRRYLTLTVEVFPSRLRYKADYEALLADTAAEIYGLVFDTPGAAYRLAGAAPRQAASAVEFFAILRQVCGDFLAAADTVLARPHHTLRTTHVVLPCRKARHTDTQTIRWLEKHPGQLLQTGGARILTAEKRVTFNTPENRLAKYMLQDVLKRLEQFKKQYAAHHTGTDDPICAQIDAMLRGLRRRCSAGVLRTIEPEPPDAELSPVFGIAPGYRELYRCCRLLRHGLSVADGVFRVSVRELDRLYRYWCFIKLNSLLQSRYRLISQDLLRFQPGADALDIAIVRDRPCAIRYLNPSSGEVITLSCRPGDMDGPTTAQSPDIILHLRKKGAAVGYDYVFDARYRLNEAPESSRYRQLYGTPGPEEDDINALHRYRDAIVQQRGSDAYERTISGAYVLFPYHDGAEYSGHRFFKSIERVNIGGLPFLPSETRLVSQLLDELIDDSPASALERAVLPSGVRERLTRADWSRRDVLVGVFRSRAQFDACKKGCFYYIPAERVPDERLPVRYVALFQTPRIFADGAGIHYYGEVLRTALVRRKTIREVPIRGPAHGEMLYYRFQVRAWLPLARPILPRESAFVNEFTTLFLLQNAELVPELLLRSEEEYRFYTELKRRAVDAEIKDSGEVSGFEFNGARVIFDGGQIRLFRGSTLVDHCSASEFLRRPGATFRRFQMLLRSP